MRPSFGVVIQLRRQQNVGWLMCTRSWTRRLPFDQGSGLYWALTSLQMNPKITRGYRFFSFQPKKSQRFDKRGVQDQDATHRRLFLLRSTQMKATSSTAKPRGSTSASPWWTSLRSASGYQRWRSKACWRRRGKRRVSLASWPVHAQQAFPVLPLTPSWSSFRHRQSSSLPRFPIIQCSFGLPASACWSRDCLSGWGQIYSPPPSAPKALTTRCLEYGFNRSPLQSRTDLLLKCSREKIRFLTNSEAAKEKEPLRGYSLLGSVHSWRTRGSARNAGFSLTVSEAVWIPRTVTYF